MSNKEKQINLSFLNEKKEKVRLDINENPYGYRITIQDSSGAVVTLNALCKWYEGEKKNEDEEQKNWSKGDRMGKEFYR